MSYTFMIFHIFCLIILAGIFGSLNLAPLCFAFSVCAVIYLCAVFVAYLGGYRATE